MAAEANPDHETWKAERLDGEWCVRTDGERGWEIVARGLTEERARLIAKAVNSHAELLAACELAVAVMGNVSAAKVVQAAIARATGKEG